MFLSSVTTNIPKAVHVVEREVLKIDLEDLKDKKLVKHKRRRIWKL